MSDNIFLKEGSKCRNVSKNFLYQGGQLSGTGGQLFRNGGSINFGIYKYYQDEYEIDDEDDEIEELVLEKNNEEIENGNKGEKISIIDFLRNLNDLSEIYRNLAFGIFKHAKINRRICNLNNILSKPSYIFLMHFLLGEKHSPKEKLGVLKFIETLMLRRHICERRTSENDNLFSKMIPYLSSINILEEIKNFIIEEEAMPSDSEFEENFSKHQFKGILVDRAKYVLESIEYYLRGNTDELIVSSSSEVHLEHIIPQTINTKKSKEEFGDWITYLGDKSVIKHKKYVNFIGNMTLLGETLNIQAYNNPFAKKKNSYKKSSFLITKELGNQNDFKFSHVDRRSERLTEIALKIWKF